METIRLELADAYLRSWSSSLQWRSDTEVALARSAFYPGGGGQVPDRGVMEMAGETLPVRCRGIRDAAVSIQPEI
ncbi:MAG: hypothetical protein Q4Q03_03460, partial [Bowdeniella nasicola]|nr:hypothetical protein [Bowdeniella nasicola]